MRLQQLFVLSILSIAHADLFSDVLSTLGISSTAATDATDKSVDQAPSSSDREPSLTDYAKDMLGLKYKEPTEVPEGCARFYVSNPNANSPHGDQQKMEDTQHWTVCVKDENSQSDRPAKYSIGAGLFDTVKDKYGQEHNNSISFISTGPKCWVDIYSKRSQKGQKYTIDPLQNVDLSDVPLHDTPGLTSYNDNVMSGHIRSSDAEDENPDSNNMPADVVPIAVWYTFLNVAMIPANSGCGYFYDSDPSSSNARVNGFALCETNGQHLAHVNQHDMMKRGFHHVLENGNIRYAVAGPDVAIGLYDKDEFKGMRKIVQENDWMALDEKKFKVESLVLLSTKYTEKKMSGPEMFVNAEKQYLDVAWDPITPIADAKNTLEMHKKKDDEKDEPCDGRVGSKSGCEEAVDRNGTLPTFSPVADTTGTSKEHKHEDKHAKKSKESSKKDHKKKNKKQHKKLRLRH